MRRDSSVMPVREPGVKHRHSRSPLAWLRVLKLFLALVATVVIPCKVWCGLESLTVHPCCGSRHTQPNDGHRNRDCCQIDRSAAEIGSRIGATILPILAASAVLVIATTLSGGPMYVPERTVLVAPSSVSQRILRI
jgi:hypothetical protein